MLTLSLQGGAGLLALPARASEPQEAGNQGGPAATGKSADVQAVLDKYRAARPEAKDLAIFRLDWAPGLKEAREKAAREQRPILLVVVTNSYGNLYTGHC